MIGVSGLKMTRDIKKEQLRLLAEKRKQNTWLGYAGIGDYHNGAYECDFVSPYTKIAGNINADVMIILQDWASSKFCEKPINNEAIEYGRVSTIRTNITLDHLLKEHLGLDICRIYATNLFPFIKQGVMNSNIPQKDLIKAAKEFALPQVQIIQPKVVICLGLKTFNALQSACTIPTSKRMSDAIASSFQYEESVIFCQAHTSTQGQNMRNRGGVYRVTADWKSLNAYIK